MDTVVFDCNDCCSQVLRFGAKLLRAELMTHVGGRNFFFRTLYFCWFPFIISLSSFYGCFLLGVAETHLDVSHITVTHHPAFIPSPLG